MSGVARQRPVLLVLASTYSRWQGDPEPGFVHELSQRLTERFRVIVLGPHAPGALPFEVLDGVEVVRYRYAPEKLETLVNDGGIVTNLKLHRWKLLLVPSFVLMQAWWTWKLCCRERIDVVHAHWLIPQGLIAAVVQRFPGPEVPFVVTSHGADLYALKGEAFNTLKRFILRRASAATVVSTAMREVVAALGADTGKVSVRPMGVDMTHRFVPSRTMERAPCELLFVGRLVEKKGLHHLLDALPFVLREHPGVRLTVAGFGPNEAALKAQADRLGLLHCVRFLGPVAQAELPALYQRAALLVAPFVRAKSGDEEGLGLVLVEAVACGCPVIAGDVLAVRQVLGEDCGEMIVNPKQPELLAGKICGVLNDPGGAQVRAMELRQTLVARLDWTTVASGYAHVLTQACGGGVEERNR